MHIIWCAGANQVNAWGIGDDESKARDANEWMESQLDQIGQERANAQIDQRIAKLEQMQRLHNALLPIMWMAIIYLLLAYLTGCAIAPQKSVAEQMVEREEAAGARCHAAIRRECKEPGVTLCKATLIQRIFAPEAANQGAAVRLGNALADLARTTISPEEKEYRKSALVSQYMAEREAYLRQIMAQDDARRFAVAQAIVGNMQATQRNQVDLWNAYQLSHPQIGIYGTPLVPYNPYYPY